MSPEKGAEQRFQRDRLRCDAQEPLHLPGRQARGIGQLFDSGLAPQALAKPEAPVEEDGRFGDFLEDSAVSSPLDEAQTKELAAEVKRALAALPPKEARVIRLRFGVGVGTPQTLNEIGAVFGLTRERIRQLEAAALSRLARGRLVNSRI